ncbi:MAG TPA: hypothetical protein VKE41_16150 [Roseiflexaceae bacterium]|nr:hypothetical protein [Roseiflexaceae bacterium]
MHTQITVRDELVFRVGRPPLEFVLDIPSDHMTVRELIRTRVEQEVAAFNQQQTEYFQGLIQPTAAELTLNGYRMPRQHRVDPVEQVERALAAFERNGFVILVDEEQVERLDDIVVLGSTTIVTFLKLVPLVGG